MPSVIDLCNTALSHIGAEGVVTSIDPPDGSVEAGHCATFWPIARRFALETARPTWAKKRVALAEVANDSQWLYAYALPSDCIHPLRVLNQGAIRTLEFSAYYAVDPNYLLQEQGSSDFEVEGGIIRTNEPEATLLYVRDVTDTTKYSPVFSSGVAMLLASYLAGPIIKGRDGMQIGNSWMQAGVNALSQAATADANGSSERAEFTAQSIQARA
jgi:hypothetical protein